MKKIERDERQISLEELNAELEATPEIRISNVGKKEAKKELYMVFERYRRCGFGEDDSIIRFIDYTRAVNVKRAVQNVKYKYKLKDISYDTMGGQQTVSKSYYGLTPVEVFLKSQEKPIYGSNEIECYKDVVEQWGKKYKIDPNQITIPEFDDINEDNNRTR